MTHDSDAGTHNTPASVATGAAGAGVFKAMSFDYPINVYKDTLRSGGEDIETLSNLTYNYQWPAVINFLEIHPNLVNSSRLTQRC